jgi:hypothetical protein
MKGKHLIEALKRKFRFVSDADLRRELGISHVALLNWRKRSITPRMVADLVSRLSGERLQGSELVKDLMGHFETDVLQQLGQTIGLSNQALQNYKNRRAVTARQMAGLGRTAYLSGQQGLRKTAIRPLVEFFPLRKAPSLHKVKFDLFSTKDEKGKVHPYLDGLRTELNAHNGVYIFFDSRGQAIYVGRARLQTLWKEMLSAFNRGREVQKIRRVRHPSRKVAYKTSDEKSRQIRERSVPLHELAGYFSAYHVDLGLIDEIESLLVRSFANDILNIRMEQFGHQRSVSAEKKRGKKK